MPYAPAMRNRWVAVMLMLVIGMQGPWAAGRTRLASDSPFGNSTSQDHDCCPDKTVHASCCQVGGVAAIAARLSPSILVRRARKGPALSSLIVSFTSRGESPRLRPPIL